MKTNRLLGVLALVGLSWGLLTACSAAPSDGAGADLGGSIPQYDLPATPDANIRTQFEGAALPDDIAQQAKNKLIDTCMASAGVTYRQGMFGAVLPSIDEMVGIADLSLDDAKREGYGATAKDDAEEPVEDASRRAYFGDGARVDVPDVFGEGMSSYSATGCEAEALASIYGTVEAGNRITGFSMLRAVMLVAEHAKKSTEYKKVVQAWAGCMAEVTSHQPADPNTARAMAESMAASEAHELAVDDAKCRTRTDFTSRHNAIVDRHLTGFKSAIEPVLVEYRALKDRAQVTSREILNG
ncbi:hypothetical protein [Leifsonia sp. PS1209]|uniref:hypothetical protein n=1 Tax=Leifsonia sp. PS1209 TaxID=2724914 RepID=UPI001442B491|nr:hypothetical protein [Leifsonia sp. PS1209]QIZ99018.1 hypothetical protein HF024_11200 [Leifsonia sp. PS1209]